MLLATRTSTCARPSTLLARAAAAVAVAPSLLRPPPPTAPARRRCCVASSSSSSSTAAAADAASERTAAATRMAADDGGDALDALYASEEAEAAVPAVEAAAAGAAPPKEAPLAPPPPLAAADGNNNKPQPAPRPTTTTVSKPPAASSGGARAPPSLLHPKQALPQDLRAAFSNAVVLVDKPPGWSSFDVCHALKRPLRALGIAKVGHAGTLDPMATGLLVVCTGQGTKSIESFMGRDKAYEATLRLGQATPSQDAETPVSEEERWEHVTDSELRRLASERLTGDGVMQRPPIYSALHAGGGKRMYELAREGGEAARRAEEARPSRPVRVASFVVEPRPERAPLTADECARLDAEQAAALAVREAAWAEAAAHEAERRAQRERRGGARTPSESSEEEVAAKAEAEAAGGESDKGEGAAANGAATTQQQPAGRAGRRDRAERAPVVPYDPRRDVRFSCVVSKGTYVRTLGADLAELAGTKGHLTQLRRTAVGDDLRVSDAWDVRELVARMREGLAAMGVEEAPPREKGGGGGGRGRRRGKGGGWRGGGNKRAKTAGGD